MRATRSRREIQSLEFSGTREESFARASEYVPVGREFPDALPEFLKSPDSAGDAPKEFQERKGGEAVSRESGRKHHLLRKMGYLVTAAVGVLVLANVNTAAYHGKCGPNAEWFWEDGVLEIKGTGEITDNPWQSDKYCEYVERDGYYVMTDRIFEIERVIIDEGITSIYDGGCSYISGYSDWGFFGAFAGEKDLTEVILPSTLEKIGDATFGDCVSLTDITIPDSVTSIGMAAFGDCVSLTSITIPDSVTAIKFGTFAGCTSLTSITIPDSVTSIGSVVFIDCNSLTGITIPDSVTTIWYEAFLRCNSLTSIIIPDSVTSIEFGTFEGCTSLTSITIPDSVTSIGGHAFSGCNSLMSITIPDSVTSIESWTFTGCTSLTSITIPDSVTSIGGNAFWGCDSLRSITFSNSVASIGSYAFNYCDSLDDSSKKRILAINPDALPEKYR